MRQPPVASGGVPASGPTQSPATQLSPTSHAVMQLPQWAGSVCRLWQAMVAAASLPRPPPVVHWFSPVGQPHVLLALQTRLASPQCSLAVHATQVLSAILQCVFIPVVHVVSSTQATQVKSVVRQMGWFMPPPPRPASGAQLALPRHSTQ